MGISLGAILNMYVYVIWTSAGEFDGCKASVTFPIQKSMHFDRGSSRNLQHLMTGGTGIDYNLLEWHQFQSGLDIIWYNVNFINNKGDRMPFWKGFGPIGRFKEVVQPWKSGWWISRIYIQTLLYCIWLIASLQFSLWRLATFHWAINSSTIHCSIDVWTGKKNILCNASLTFWFVSEKKKLPKVSRDRFSMMEVAHFWNLRSFFAFFLAQICLVFFLLLFLAERDTSKKHATTLKFTKLLEKLHKQKGPELLFSCIE